jgi:hypothetical protein
VGLVGDDQIEEPHVETLIALHHGGVGGQIDALVRVLGCGVREVNAGFAGQVLLKNVVGLLAQLAPVAEEQDPLDPAARISTSQRAAATRVLPVPVAITRSMRRCLFPRRSRILVMASNW